MIRALYVLYLVSILGIPPALLGLIYAAGSIGFPLGAFLAGPVKKRLGTGLTIIWGVAASNAAQLLIVLAQGSLGYAVLVLIASQVLVAIPGAVTAINQSSMRQALTPKEMQGRVTGVSFFLSSGLGTVGGFLAGIGGQVIGVRTTLIFAVIGIQLGTMILLLSPFRRFRELPAVS